MIWLTKLSLNTPSSLHETLVCILTRLYVRAGHPVWNLRTKTPNNEQTTVPWHQDNAYLSQDALYTFMPTAWIPLIDANKENGCMEV